MDSVQFDDRTSPHCDKHRVNVRFSGRRQFAVKKREVDPPGTILISILRAHRGQLPTYAVPAALQ